MRLTTTIALTIIAFASGLFVDYIKPQKNAESASGTEPLLTQGSRTMFDIADTLSPFSRDTFWVDGVPGYIDTNSFSTKEHHIKVECFTKGPGSAGYYAIYFTPDNWETELSIKRAADINMYITSGYSVAFYPFYATHLFRTSEEAVSFARKNLKSIKDCYYYNNKQEKKHEANIEYAKKHPPKHLLLATPECKSIQIF